MEYNEGLVLTNYVWDHYRHLMTPLERRAEGALNARIHADLSKSPGLAEQLRERWGLMNDAEVNATLAVGGEVFRQRVRDRLLAAFPEQVFIHRCPRCSCIVRTPRARLCTWCGQTWHEDD